MAKVDVEKAISMDFNSWKKTMDIQQTFSSLNAGDT